MREVQQQRLLKYCWVHFSTKRQYSSLCDIFQSVYVAHRHALWQCFHKTTGVFFMQTTPVCLAPKIKQLLQSSGGFGPLIEHPTRISDESKNTMIYWPK